jgi:hypothetical protein
MISEVIAAFTEMADMEIGIVVAAVAAIVMAIFT